MRFPAPKNIEKSVMPTKSDFLGESLGLPCTRVVPTMRRIPYEEQQETTQSRRLAAAEPLLSAST